MGLDVTAFRQLKLVKRSPLTDEDYESEDVYLYPVPDFGGYTDDLGEGMYRTEEESYGFRAGSYGRYNRWRSYLARVIDRTPHSIWNDPGQQIPFLELINNSDCEGFIGPRTSAKLAEDFRSLRSQAEKKASSYWPEEKDWFMSLYDRWTQAFVIASDNGAVKLH